VLMALPMGVAIVIRTEWAVGESSGATDVTPYHPAPPPIAK